MREQVGDDLGRAGGQDDVAGERHVGAGSRRHAIDRADHWEGQGAKPAHQRVVGPLERVPEEHERKGQAFHPDGRPLEESQNAYVRAMAGEVVEAEEVHHIDEHGVARVLEVSAFPVPHAEGAPGRVMMIIRDVTAASTHRESLASFAGTVAHDLNNPLSVIDGWADLVRRLLSD